MLTKKDAAKIAELVNSLMVAEMMRDDGLKASDLEMTARWQKHADEAVVSLWVDYGIELPILPAAHKRHVERAMAEQIARRA